MGKRALWTGVLCVLALCLTTGAARAEQIPGSTATIAAGAVDVLPGAMLQAADRERGENRDGKGAEKADDPKREVKDEARGISIAIVPNDGIVARREGRVLWQTKLDGQAPTSLRLEKDKVIAQPGRIVLEVTTGRVISVGEERSGKGENPARVEKADRTEKSERAERAEKAEKGDKGVNLDADSVHIIINGKEVKLGPGQPGQPGEGKGNVFVIREGKEGEGREAAERGERKGEKKYGFLGVMPAPVGEALADQLDLNDGRGVLLAEVEEGTPAAKAGLRENDVLTGVENQIIYSIEQLQKLIAAHKPGSAVEVHFIHKGHAQSAKVVLGGSAVRSWGEHEEEGLNETFRLHGLGGGLGNLPHMLFQRGGMQGRNPMMPMPGQQRGQCQCRDGEKCEQCMGRNGEPCTCQGMPGGRMGEGPMIHVYPGQGAPGETGADAQRRMQQMRDMMEHMQGQGGPEGKALQEAQAKALKEMMEKAREQMQRQGGEMHQGFIGPDGQFHEGHLMMPPPGATQKLWTVPELKELMEQVKATVKDETWASVRKALTAMGDKKLSAGQAIERLAPIQKEISEKAWKWLTDKLQGKPVGAAPVPAVGEGRPGEGVGEMLEREHRQLLEHRPQLSEELGRKWEEYIRSERGEKAPEPAIVPPAVVEALTKAVEQMKDSLAEKMYVRLQSMVSHIRSAKETPDQVAGMLQGFRDNLPPIVYNRLSEILVKAQKAPVSIAKPARPDGERTEVRVGPGAGQSSSSSSSSGGLVTSTVSASSANYQATWTTRTGHPITVTLTGKEGKVILKDVPVSELASVRPNLDKEAQELLSRINPSPKAP